jgi:hypothetical protein
MGVIKPTREQEPFGMSSRLVVAVEKRSCFVRRVSDARSLLEGIERLAPLFEQFTDRNFRFHCWPTARYRDSNVAEQSRSESKFRPGNL